MRPEIQRYLDALDEAGENRVLQGKLRTREPWPDENGARCLVGHGEDVRGMDHAARERWPWRVHRVGYAFDAESRVRGLDVVGAEIRDYLLQKQAARHNLTLEPTTPRNITETPVYAS